MKPTKQLIQFTHIARTGGSSFRSSILLNFPISQTQFIPTAVKCNWIRVILDNEIVIAPHDLKLVFMHLPFRETTFFYCSQHKIKLFQAVLLREPIKRTLSVLKHCLILAPRNYSNIAKYWEATNGNLDEVLIKCLKHKFCCNVMCKQLSGLDDITNTICTESDSIKGELYSPWHQSKEKYTHEQMSKLLNAAKLNLKHHYDFVGFQETFNDDIVRFCSQLELQRSCNREIKNLDDDISEFTTTDNNIKTLTQMNQYDIELYNYAKSLNH